MRYVFLKNFIELASTFVSVLILDLILFMGVIFVFPIFYIFLWIMFGVGVITLLYIFIGFYWLFQTVTIDDSGISIYFFHKVIRKVSWKEIESIEKCSHLTNPALRLIVHNQKPLFLDRRKKIISAIETCQERSKALTQDE